MLLPILSVLAITLWIACTTAAPGLEARIVKGAFVKQLTELPSMASVGTLGRGSSYSHRCGGVVLSKSVVLTAAHCFIDLNERDQVAVRVGSLENAKGGTLATVRSRIPHPSYDPKEHDFDIAVLFLKDALELGPASTVRKAKLVKAGTAVAQDQDLIVAGWGVTAAGAPKGAKSTPLLRKATLSTIDHAECGAAYTKLNKGPITERMFCTDSTQGKYADHGDSGGPLFNTTTGELVGCVSWADDDNKATAPGVHANLADPDIHKWITEQLAYAMAVLEGKKKEPKAGSSAPQKVLEAAPSSLKTLGARTTSSNALEPRILGGSKVGKPTEFPSIASIGNKTHGFNGCAGAIVSPFLVVTAAHCKLGADTQVRVGSLTHADGGELVDVAKWVKHPDYDDDTKQFDVAVLLLAYAIDLSKESPIRAATLVPAGTALKKGQKLKVAAWGLTKPNAAPTLAMASPVLNQVTLPVMDLAKCKRQDRRVTDRNFCTQSARQGVCRGDSGAPLFDVRKGVLLGGVSYAVGGCEPKKGKGAQTDLDANIKRGLLGSKMVNVHTNYADPKINQWIRGYIDKVDKAAIKQMRPVGKKTGE